VCAPQVIALLSFLAGWRIGYRWSRWNHDVEEAWAGMSNAGLSLVLSMGSVAVALAIWMWVASQRPGKFHDQGGMILSLVVLPWMLTLWFAGGPLSLFLSWRARKQLSAMEADRHMFTFAGIGSIISVLVIFSPLIVLILERLGFVVLL
jgi:hypothetical protein